MTHWIHNDDYTAIVCPDCGHIIRTNPVIARTKSYGFPCTACEEIEESRELIEKLLNLTRQIPLPYLHDKLENMRSERLLDGVSRLVHIVRLERLGQRESIKQEIKSEMREFLEEISVDDMKDISLYLHRQLRNL